MAARALSRASWKSWCVVMEIDFVIIFSSLTFHAPQVHRRTLHDDNRGVDEPLNETGTSGLGLVVTGAPRVVSFFSFVKW